MQEWLIRPQDVGRDLRKEHVPTLSSLVVGWLVSWSALAVQLFGKGLFWSWWDVPTAPYLLARQQYQILSCILQYCFHWQKIFYLSSLLHPPSHISCYFYLKHVGIFESIQLHTVMFSINRYVTKEILLQWGYLVFEIHEKVCKIWRYTTGQCIMRRHFKFCSFVVSLFALF